MIELLPKILMYKMQRVLNQPPLLPINLTVSLSHKCNSSCLTCRIWKKKTQQLTLEELDKIFSSLGNAPYWVTLSGGEPFLREDIVEIVQALYNRCRPAIINIPTNGSFPHLIPDRVKQICQYVSRSKVVVNLSLDGVGQDHDRIRNFIGGFALAMKTFEGLKSLNLPNFTPGIGTVISRFNVEKLPRIYEYVATLKPDSYVTEIAEERVELDTLGMGITPCLKDYCQAVDFLVSKMKEKHGHGIPEIIRAFRLEYYELVKRILAEERQIIPCYAGLASAQIQPDGQVWACCIKGESMGNLREADYNFKKIWSSRKASQLRQKIKAGRCYCPLASAAYTNMLCHTPTLLRCLAKIILSQAKNVR